MATGEAAPSPAGASAVPNSNSTDPMVALKQALDENGVAVIPNVLTHEECDKHAAQLQGWLAKFGPHGFPDNLGSIIHKYSISQHPVHWETRLKAAPVFQSLWGTEKLTTSLDGMAIGQPPEYGYHSFVDGKQLALHLDQGGEKVGLHAYQGAVYLEDADEDDWCFAVMNGSHKYHAEYYANRTTKLPWTEYLKLTKKEIRWYEDQGCAIRRVAVPKGGMVLWDSRTVHTGAPPLRHRQNPLRWRYVVFVCMVPAIWASDKDMAKKKNAYHKLYISRHWPAQGFSTFRSCPAPVELNAVNELPEIARTDKARLLAGDLEYDYNDGEPNGPAEPQLKTTSSIKQITPTEQDAQQTGDEKKRKCVTFEDNVQKRQKVNPTKQKTKNTGIRAATGKKRAKALVSNQSNKIDQQHKKKPGANPKTLNKQKKMKSSV